MPDINIRLEDANGVCVKRIDVTRADVPRVVVWGRRAFLYSRTEVRPDYVDSYSAYREVDALCFEPTLEENLAECRKWRLTDAEVEELLK